MTNDEIDIRLRMLADAIPKRAEMLYERAHQARFQIDESLLDGIRTELELLNMSMIGVFTMLGEIAKRLPESVVTVAEDRSHFPEAFKRDAKEWLEREDDEP